MQKSLEWWGQCQVLISHKEQHQDNDHHALQMELYLSATFVPRIQQT